MVDRSKYFIAGAGAMWLALGLSTVQAFDDMQQGVSQAQTDAWYLQLTGGTVSGDLAITGTTTLTAGGTITTTANGDVTIDANGTGLFVVNDGASLLGLTRVCSGACPTWVIADGAGDLGAEDELEAQGAAYIGGLTQVCSGACPSWATLEGAGDLGVEDEIEVDGEARFDGNLYGYGYTYLFAQYGPYIGGANAAGSIHFGSNQANAQVGLFLDDTLGRQLVIGDSAVSAYGNDYDHDLQTNPTIYIHSSLDPDTVNSRWGAFAHDGTSASAGAFNITTGSGNILLDSGSGYVDSRDALYVGDGTYSWGACDGSAGEGCFEDELEVDGAARFDGTATFNSTVTFSTNTYLYNYSTAWGATTAADCNVFSSNPTTGQSALLLDDKLGRQLIIGDTAVSAYTYDYDHATQTDPTLFIHSALNPDTNNTRWGSLYHDGTSAAVGSFNIGSGSGPVAIGTASGFNPASVTSDPCGGAGYKAGSIFYNSTSGIWCGCNQFLTDIKIDGSSADCF